MLQYIRRLQLSLHVQQVRENKQKTSTRLGILYNLHFIVKPFHNSNPQSIH